MERTKLLGSLFILGLIISQESPASARVTATLPRCGEVGLSLSPPTGSYVFNANNLVFYPNSANNAGSDNDRTFFAVVTRAAAGTLRYNVLRSSDNTTFTNYLNNCSAITTPSCTSRGAVTLSSGRGGAGSREMANFEPGYYYKIEISQSNNSCSPRSSPVVRIGQSGEGDVRLILGGSSNPWTRGLQPAFATERTGGGYLFWSGVAPQAMNQIEAVAYCTALGEGFRLPTKDEYVALSRAMGTLQPVQTDGIDMLNDYNLGGYNKNFIQDMNERNFWSETIHPTTTDFAFIFRSRDGGLQFYGRDEGAASVRCVR